MSKKIDLKKEQEAALARPRLKYGLIAKILFNSLDLIHGKATTLGKAKLLETLARIPYQAWEIRQYGKMNRAYGNDEAVKTARDLIDWGREAQDNEFWHLRVLTERMEKLKIKESFFHKHLVPPVAVITYTIFSRLFALINIKGAFQLNAEFEDHAEHVYMQYVKDNPQLENEAVDDEAPKEIADFENWADVFRRIGLDEREHMNNSLIHCGRESEVVPIPSP